MKKFDRDHFEQLVGLADAYLMGELDAAGLSALELMVCEDPAAAEALAQYLRQAGALREGLAESAKAERESSEPELSEYLSILSELDGAQTQPVDLTDELARRKEAELERRRRRSAIVEADTPVARVLVIPRPVVWLAGAAAILLLTLVFWPDPQAEKTDPGPARVVATLTAEHNARWASGLPASGDALVSGQRLTLTDGFAHITTARGAVAILEAPCTVELIDSPNALRLHAGKLVGICETESSKGFLVRTPQMDIIDLGTRFGVDASRREATEVHVYQGEVEVAHGAADGTGLLRERIVGGQAVRVDAAGTLEPIAFVSDDPQPWLGPWVIYRQHDGSARMLSQDGEPKDPSTDQTLRWEVTGAGNNYSAASLSRGYGSLNRVDTTKPHVIRFTYRLDHMPAAVEGEVQKTSNTKIAIFDGVEKVAGSSHRNTWSMHAYLWQIPSESIRPHVWMLYDGDGEPDPDSGQMDYRRLVSTGIALEEGVAYDVEIRIDPEHAQWDVVLVSGEDRYDSRAALGRPLRFRNGADQVYGHIHFNTALGRSDRGELSISGLRIEPLAADGARP